jgi:hypothetical protein
MLHMEHATLAHHHQHGVEEPREVGLMLIAMVDGRGR